LILFVFVKEKVEYYEKICRREFGGDERERGRGEVWAALSVSPTLAASLRCLGGRVRGMRSSLRQ